MATHAAAAAKPSRDLAAEVAYLTRALKAPTLRESVDRLAERARAESWTHEEFLVACLQREVSARESHGGEGRIRAARFPARTSLEEFDFDHARGLKRDLVAHLGTRDFVVAKDNVVFLGPVPRDPNGASRGFARRFHHGVAGRLEVTLWRRSQASPKAATVLRASAGLTFSPRILNFDHVEELLGLALGRETTLVRLSTFRRAIPHPVLLALLRRVHTDHSRAQAERMWTKCGQASIRSSGSWSDV